MVKKARKKSKKVPVRKVRKDGISQRYWKSLNKRAKRKYPKQDWDADGKKNWEDCVPLDPNKQDVMSALEKDIKDRLKDVRDEQALVANDIGILKPLFDDIDDLDFGNRSGSVENNMVENKKLRIILEEIGKVSDDNLISNSSAWDSERSRLRNRLGELSIVPPSDRTVFWDNGVIENGNDFSELVSMINFEIDGGLSNLEERQIVLDVRRAELDREFRSFKGIG